MKSFLTLLFCLSLFPLLRETEAAQQAQKDDIYVVYMGATTSSNRNDHVQLLSSLTRRKRNAVVHNYNNGFSGFAAHLSKEEAQSISKRPGVVSVFRDPVLQLHTTHSWDFLKHQTDVVIDSTPSSTSSALRSGSHGADTVIGILDTGIWPESESFSDKDMGPIPSHWKGTCMEGHDFTSANCNRKLIGARYYADPNSETDASSTPRDKDGHGTHVAATAAGSPVPGASYHGLAQGTAKGGSPGSRIATYRVCTPEGCRGSAILKAFDDAIKDGVDVLSLSLGSIVGLEPEFLNDPIAIGAFHAVENGILVVCSAGNEGPYPKSVVNTAPWILTVAATTIDRDFESDVVLGGKKVIKGGGINFADIQKTPVFPLTYGGSAKSDSQDVSDGDARHCMPGSLDEKKVKGKIVICDNGEYSPSVMLESVKSQGGIGLVLIDDDARTVPSSYGSFPMAAVTETDGALILAYMNSTRDPVATILPTVSVTKFKPAPTVAYFSSRGPSSITKSLLKPDIAAPGVAILAAWPGNDTKAVLSGQGDPPQFNIQSGTSMACPHVSGIAATVKSQNPTWSPSAIKSAIMTTGIQTNNLKAPITTNSGSSGIQTNNLKAPITTNSGSIATPYDIGAGEVGTSGPLQPGLVYETEVSDYLQFFCNIGYNVSRIKLIFSALPDKFSCPNNSGADLISNMNYPSIAVSNLKGSRSKKVTRTVTNVGEGNTAYTAIVDAPAELQVKVTPTTMKFNGNNNKMSYKVSFSCAQTSSPGTDLFGSITWTNGKYKVRSPFVVTTD